MKSKSPLNFSSKLLCKSQPSRAIQPSAEVRPLERASPEEEDQVIAGNWTDPDLRDHPSVVDWRKAAVLGKLGKQNRIDRMRIELIRIN